MIRAWSYHPLMIIESDPYAHELTASLGVISVPNIPCDDTISSSLRKIRLKFYEFNHIAQVTLVEIIILSGKLEPLWMLAKSKPDNRATQEHKGHIGFLQGMFFLSMYISMDIG